MKKALPLLILSLAALSSAAKPFKAGSPSAVADEALQARVKKDWTKYSDLMHPDAMKKFRAMFEPVLKDAETSPNGKDFLKMFDGVKDFKELAALAPPRFFASFNSGFLSRIEEKMGKMPTQNEVLGEVLEGQNLAHVVYRMKVNFSGQNIDRVDLVTLKKTPGGWRMLLSGEMDIEKMVQQMIRGLKAPLPPGSPPAR